MELELAVGSLYIFMNAARLTILSFVLILLLFVTLLLLLLLLLLPTPHHPLVSSFTA